MSAFTTAHDTLHSLGLRGVCPMSSSLRKAFDHADAIKRLPDRLRAGALCASYRQLLIGSTEGTLLHFGHNARGASSSRGFSSDEQFMSETARYRRFAPEKQPILALIAVPSWNPKDGGLLLALSPASITAHALGRLLGHLLHGAVHADAAARDALLQLVKV